MIWLKAAWAAVTARFPKLSFDLSWLGAFGRFLKKLGEGFQVILAHPVVLTTMAVIAPVIFVVGFKAGVWWDAGQVKKARGETTSVELQLATAKSSIADLTRRLANAEAIAAASTMTLSTPPAPAPKPKPKRKPAAKTSWWPL